MSQGIAPAQFGCDANTALERVKVQLDSHQGSDDAAQALGEILVCGALTDSQLFEVGWLYGRARHFGDALKTFARVPGSVPDRTTHVYAVALSQFELGDYNGASRQLAALHAAGAADTKSENLLAVCYSKLGLYKEAYAVLAQEVRKNPQVLESHLNLIKVCAEGGDFKSAAQAAADATRLFPNSADAFVAQGAAEALLGHLTPAYDDFAYSARLDPKRADIQFFMALMDYKMDKFAEAARILDAAIKKTFNDSELHYLLAECWLKLDAGTTSSALEEVNEAITLNPNSASARTLRGKLLLESGLAEQAIPDLEFVRRQDPEYRSATYNLARAYRLVGRSADSQAMFAKIHNQSVTTISDTSDRRLNDILMPKEAGPQ